MGRPFPMPSSEALSAHTHSGERPSSRANSVEDSMTRSYGDCVGEVLRDLRHFSFVVTDPYLPGHPIVYASEAFFRMTGYVAHDVVGKNPRFLQGLSTDRRTIAEIRHAILEERGCHMVLLNYTKKGWPFRVAFFMAPVFSQSDGKLLHFVGAHKPFADPLFPQMEPCERTTVGLCKVYTSAAKDIIWADSSCHQISDGQLSYVSSGQPKKEMAVASNVLGLVIHELVKFNKLMNEKSFQGRCLHEKTESGVCSSLCLALNRIQHSFVLCKFKLPGMPVAYASDMFLKLTGYGRDDIIGRSCRFLQGRDTNSAAVDKMRDAIRQGRFCTVRILNYCKDGSSFWNHLHISPVRDYTGKVEYYVGVQVSIPVGLDVGGCEARRDVTPTISQLGVVGAVKVAVRTPQDNTLCATAL